MSDAFVSFVALRPFVSVQLEPQYERDRSAQPDHQGQMKQNVFATRTKRGASRPTFPSAPWISDLLDGNTVALWEFETGPGLVDEAGNFTFPAGSNTLVPGLRGQALRVLGSTNEMNLSEEQKAMMTAALHSPQGWTWEGWYRHSSENVSAYPTLFGVIHDGHWQYRPAILNFNRALSSLYFDGWTQSGSFQFEVLGAAQLTTLWNTWIHFAVRHRPAAGGAWHFDVFVNGVLRRTLPAYAQTLVRPGNLQLNIGGNPATGVGNLIDSFRISNKARSDTEILDFYNRTK